MILPVVATLAAALLGLGVIVTLLLRERRQLRASKYDEFEQARTQAWLRDLKRANETGEWDDL